MLVGDAADEVLDVDAAVAQGASGSVGLGDLGGEGDDAFKAGLHPLDGVVGGVDPEVGRLETGPRSLHSLSGLAARRGGCLVGRYTSSQEWTCG